MKISNQTSAPTQHWSFSATQEKFDLARTIKELRASGVDYGAIDLPNGSVLVVRFGGDEFGVTMPPMRNISHPLLWNAQRQTVDDVALWDAKMIGNPNTKSETVATYWYKWCAADIASGLLEQLARAYTALAAERAKKRRYTVCGWKVTHEHG